MQNKAEVSETFLGTGKGQKELRSLGIEYETVLGENQSGFSVNFLIPEINLRVRAIFPRSESYPSVIALVRRKKKRRFNKASSSFSSRYFVFRLFEINVVVSPFWATSSGGVNLGPNWSRPELEIALYYLGLFFFFYRKIVKNTVFSFFI